MHLAKKLCQNVFEEVTIDCRLLAVKHEDISRSNKCLLKLHSDEIRVNHQQ